MTVTVYSKPACGQCLATTRTLDKHDIEYEYIDITKTPGAGDAVKALGYLQAPVVVVNGDHWSGFRPDKLDELASLIKAA